MSLTVTRRIVGEYSPELIDRGDGRLVKDNLRKEAGVSRATISRARLVMAEWDTQVVACDGLPPGEARKHDELTQLRAKLADKTREYLPHQPRPNPRYRPTGPGR